MLSWIKAHRVVSIILTITLLLALVLVTTQRNRIARNASTTTFNDQYQLLHTTKTLENNQRITNYPTFSADKVVKNDITSLIPAATELPNNIILGDLSVGESVAQSLLPGIAGANKLHLQWYGTSARVYLPGVVPFVRNIRFDVAIAVNAVEATKCAKTMSASNSTSIPEISTREAQAAFADHVWSGGSERIIFIRGNVLCDISVSSTEQKKDNGVAEAKLLFTLAHNTAKKVDALLAKKPFSTPAMPLSMSELHLSLEEAWKNHPLNFDLWKTNVPMIQIIKNGIPRLIPARFDKKFNDYFIPLNYVLPLLDAKASIVIERNKIMLTFRGRNITIDTCRQQLEEGRMQYLLPIPITIDNNTVIVTLKALRNILRVPLKQL